MYIHRYGLRHHVSVEKRCGRNLDFINLFLNIFALSGEKYKLNKSDKCSTHSARAQKHDKRTRRATDNDLG
jgi:hypothetical protein